MEQRKVTAGWMVLFTSRSVFWKRLKRLEILLIIEHRWRVRIADAVWRPAFGLTTAASPVLPRVSIAMERSACPQVRWILAERAHPLPCNWLKDWASLLNPCVPP